MKRGHLRTILEKSRSDFAHCQKKRQWRQDTVVNFYRQVFNRFYIPLEQSYVTLCAKCGYEPEAQKAGQLREGCEPDQLLKEGFIFQSQFYGIEGNSEIHEINKSVHGSFHWRCGDFLRILSELSCGPNFKPAVICYDSIHFPETFIDYFPRILRMATEKRWEDLLIVGNFVLTAHGRSVPVTAILKAVEKSEQAQFAFQFGNWKMHSHYYQYDGKGSHSATKMGTILFYNRKGGNNGNKKGK